MHQHQVDIADVSLFKQVDEEAFYCFLFGHEEIMKIIIGKTADIRFENRPVLPPNDGKDLAVRVLNVRRARSGGKYYRQGKDRRESEKSHDPVNAKVLVLLVPDGNGLPADIADGNYQVRVRIFSENDGKPESKSAVSRSDGFTRRV